MKFRVSPWCGAFTERLEELGLPERVFSRFDDFLSAQPVPDHVNDFS